MAEKIVFPINEKMITTPIWLKLLAINMVANNFFGRCNNFETRFALTVSSSNSVFKSFGVSEKRAISAAETIAEQKRNRTIAILPKSKSVSIVVRKLKLGSESNSGKIS